MGEFWSTPLTYGSLFWIWIGYTVVGGFVVEFVKELWRKK